MLLCLYFVIFSLAAPASEPPAPPPGRPSCARRLIISGKRYFADVYRSAGLRFFLKPERVTGESGIYNSLIRQPTAQLTERLRLGRLEPTFLSLILATIFMWHGVDAATDELYEAKINRQIEYDSFFYDEMVDFDYRFHRIKIARESGIIGVAEERRQAFWLKMSLDRYYELRSSDLRGGRRPDLKDEVKYLVLFPHLREVIYRGVHPVEGFAVPQASVGLLTADRILKLFAINHDLYFEYQRVIEMLKGHLPLDADPFTERIVGMWRAQKLSRAEAQYVLQEDAFWRHRFLEWHTLGVKRLNVTNGKELRLEDIRKEILDDLERGN